MMFSIITDNLPSSIDIGDGVFVPINTSFKRCIKFENIMFGANDLSNRDKVIQSFELFGIPDKLIRNNAKSVMDGIIDFYRCFKPVRKLNKRVAEKMKGVRQPKYFDFTYDAPYIYAAFMHDYGIDLVDTDLHWFKFKALFDALSAETQFAKIISYRGTDVSQIKDAKEKARITKLQFLYALPRTMTEEQKAAEIGMAFQKIEGNIK
ncbi:MAG: hypothetical protein IKP95_09395 [Ruminococcus sp.]|nr:hypothetical protein [Ruminococcus sp.]